MKLAVCNLKNEKVGEVALNAEVFSRPVRADILSRVVRWQLAKRRAGTHATKGISDVSGTTRKPHKQKGTGRARQGSLRSPQFRGGGIVFGPQVRSHAYALPKRIRRLGLSVALSSKVSDKKFFVIDAFALPSGRTKDLRAALSFWGKRVLCVSSDKVEPGFARAASNLWQVNSLPVMGLNVYDILRHDCVVIEKGVLQAVEGRLI